MAYNATYELSDIADITGDVIGKTAVETKDFTSLLVILGMVILFGAGVAYLMRRR